MNRKYNFNENFFKKINTEQKAYWLGFVMADGCIYARTFTLEIHLHSKDKKHLQKFLNDIEADNPIYQYHPNKCSVRINSKKLTSDLSQYGVMPRKTFKTYFPTQIPKIFQQHFIRGIFDGDGCLSIFKRNVQRYPSNKSICFAIAGNKKLLLTIQKILVERCKLLEKEPCHCPTTFYLMYGGIYQVKRILDYLYKNATVYLERKHQLYRNFFYSRSKEQIIEEGWNRFFRAIFVDCYNVAIVE